MRRAIATLVALSIVVVTAPAAMAAKPMEVTTVAGPIDAGSPDGEAFVAELEALVHGPVSIDYEQSFDLAGLVTGPNPPDIIVSPQPEVLEFLADDLVDLGGVVNENKLRKDFGDYVIDIASADGKVLGAPVSVDLKSLVWYKPAAFAAAGCAVPESFTELVALSDQMVADGDNPWCNYIESSPATGWVGTDWVEELLLGAEGGAVYDDWSITMSCFRIRVSRRPSSGINR